MRSLLLLSLTILLPTASAEVKLPTLADTMNLSNPDELTITVAAKHYKIPRCPTGYHRNANGVCRIILPKRE